MHLVCVAHNFHGPVGQLKLVVEANVLQRQPGAELRQQSSAHSEPGVAVQMALLTNGVGKSAGEMNRIDDGGIDCFRRPVGGPSRSAPALHVKRTRTMTALAADRQLMYPDSVETAFDGLGPASVASQAAFPHTPGEALLIAAVITGRHCPS
jgi:hypothetical protein